MVIYDIHYTCDVCIFQLIKTLNHIFRDNFKYYIEYLDLYVLIDFSVLAYV